MPTARTSPTTRSTPSPASRRAPRAPAPLLASLLAATLGTALAAPGDALEVRGGDVAVRQAQVVEAAEELERERGGIEATLTAGPEVAYVIPLPGETAEGGLGFDPDVTGSVRYLYDRAAILEAEKDLLEARIRLEDAVRSDVEDALVLLADAARAEIARAEGEADVANARASLAAREADGSSPVLVDEARLEVRMREGDLAAAEAALADALARLDRLGLAPASADEITSARFALPAPAAEGELAAPDLALRSLDVEIARAEAAEAGAFSVLRQLELSASYQDDGRLARVSALLDQGRPGVEVAGELDRSNRTGAFVVSVGAELRVSTTTSDEIGDAERAVEEAELELAARAADVAEDDARLRREIARDLEVLELDLADLAIEEARAAELEELLATLPARIEELRAELESARAQRDAAEGDARRALDDEVRALENEVRVVERELADAGRELGFRRDGILTLRDRALRDWIAYVRDVTDLLDVAGARWALSGNGG